MDSLFSAIHASVGGVHGLPNGVYTRRDFFDWERRHIFAPRWFGVAFGADVPEVGDVRKVDVLGTSIIVVRDRDGINVFHNVCRHRGRQLVDETATRAVLLRCPYHAWTYRLDGTLNGTPNVGGAGVHAIDGFDKSAYGLFRIESRVWMDTVFINLDGRAAPFEEYFAPVEERLTRLWGPSARDALRPARGDCLEMEVASNWKLAVENYLESYHLPTIHPGLNGYSPLSRHYHYHDAEDFAGQGVTSYDPVPHTGKSMPTIPGWPEHSAKTAEYPALYPNVLIGAQNDHFYTMLLLPVDADRTLERARLQFVGDAASNDESAATRAAILEGWRNVFQEDVEAVQGMQTGRRCDAFDGGVFTPLMDQPTRHFHRWFAARVEDALRAA